MNGLMEGIMTQAEMADLQDQMTQVHQDLGQAAHEAMAATDDAQEVRQALANGHSPPVEATVSYPVPLLEGSRSRSGLIYDTKMMLHSTATGSSHPERPERISEIFRVLQAHGVLKRLKRLPIREVTKKEVRLIHSDDLWARIEATETIPPFELALNEPRYERMSLYINNSTAYCARLAAGGTVEICQAVAQGRINNGIAVVRPPGHHAEPDESMGFCIFNNVAIAAKAVQSTGEVRKVLILDWDVHHGNGTQRAFNDDPSVLYISIHRYDDGTFYPGSTFGGPNSCGEGAGIGTSVNVPWPTRGMGDADYIYAFQRIVMPIAYEFAPDMVIISAGFDAAAGDELGGCLVTPAGYAHMTQMLSSLANGKLVVILEGGYNVDAISSSALACTRILLGEAPPMLPPMIATPVATETIHQVALVQSKYWKSISPVGLEHELDAFGDEEFDEQVADILASSASLAEVMRAHRANFLAEEFDMSEVHLPNAFLQTVFKDQVYATGNVFRANTLVIFAHDLASIKAELESSTANVVLERARMLDVSKLVLDWASKNDFAVIDVNLKNHLPTRSNDYKDKQVSDIVRTLMFFIWDNYVDLKPDLDVVIVGQGTGCEALMQLVNGRTLRPHVKACVEILDSVTLPRVANRSELREWFYSNSLVIMPGNHIVGAQIEGKRFGSLYQSKESRLEKLFFSTSKIWQQFLEQKLGRLAPSSDVPLRQNDLVEDVILKGTPSMSNLTVEHKAPEVSIGPRSRFRPCIDIRQGQVTQIVGGTMTQAGDATVNFVAQKTPDYYAELFQKHNLIGGHVVMLGPGNEAAARTALKAWPNSLQIGGKVNPENAVQWLRDGASKVIVTSYLFPNGVYEPARLKEMVQAVGKERLVIDLSCRRQVNGGWKVAMNGWRDLTDTIVSAKTLTALSRDCSEFLIHSADVEGLCKGIDRDLVKLLGSWAQDRGQLAIPVTYAGGAFSIDDIKLVSELSRGLVDLTYGSALDIYGGRSVQLADLIQWNAGIV